MRSRWRPFLTHLDSSKPSLISHLQIGSSHCVSSKFRPKSTWHFSGSAESVTATLSTSYSQSLPALLENTVHTPSRKPFPNPLSASKTIPSEEPQIYRFSTPENIRELLTQTMRNLPPHWKTTRSPSIQSLSDSFSFISPRIEILTTNERSLEFLLSYHDEEGTTIDPAEIRRLLRSQNDRIRRHESNDRFQRYLKSDRPIV